MSEHTVPVGVIGVGTMGQHHARVYGELSDSELVGVHDLDSERAQEIATKYGTSVRPIDEMLDKVKAVSIAVPTQHHFEIVKRALESDVAVLVEKPFVATENEGERLIEMANDRSLPLQVGHIERFNPAIQTLKEVIRGEKIIAMDASRLGPDLDREIQDTVVADLMIHDLDIVRSLVESEIVNVKANGTAKGQYGTATIEFEDGTIATLTASRKTERKIRSLNVTAEDRYIQVDYLNKSVEIHRQSAPEYITENDDVRYRHEGIIERPSVDNVEPLKKELNSFLTAVTEGTEPVVTGADGLRALKYIWEIDDQAFSTENPSK